MTVSIRSVSSVMPGAELVDDLQVHSDHEPVVVGEPTGQCCGELLGLVPQAHPGQGGQYRRVPFPDDQCLQHGPAGHSKNVTGHTGQLDPGICAPRGAAVRVEVRDHHR